MISRQRRLAGLGRRDVLRAAILAPIANVLTPHSALGQAVKQAVPNDLAETVRSVIAGDLKVAYADLGPPSGDPVILLHGWPYDIHSFAEAGRLLAARGRRVLIPYLRGFGPTRFLSPGAPRIAQPAALGKDVVDFMDALNLPRATIGGFDWGARTAAIVGAIWPDRVAGLVLVSGYLISNQTAGMQPLQPEAEYRWWYQFYFATERGRVGYDKHRTSFARLIWQLGSPRWRFSEETFARSAAAFDNPDHVDIVVHNYRWRLGLAQSSKALDGIERKLAHAPAIAVPAITLEGDANGAPYPPPESYARKFTGKYEHRTIRGGIGHNLPQEAPAAFAQAILDVGQSQGARP